jgi:arylsulfatase A-like enzyme
MKSDAWEAGHRVPFIASWPGNIEAGAVSDEPIIHTDIISTVASMLKIEGAEASMVDSYDISSVLLGKESKTPIREALVHHSGNGTFAIRKGEWKLILGKNSGGFSNNLKIEGIPVETDGQLYNLKKDPKESVNLWEKNPEVVKDLTALLEKYKTEGRSVSR